MHRIEADLIQNYSNHPLNSYSWHVYDVTSSINSQRRRDSLTLTRLLIRRPFVPTNYDELLAIGNGWVLFFFQQVFIILAFGSCHESYSIRIVHAACSTPSQQVLSKIKTEFHYQTKRPNENASTKPHNRCLNQWIPQRSHCTSLRW